MRAKPNLRPSAQQQQQAAGPLSFHASLTPSGATNKNTLSDCIAMTSSTRSDYQDDISIDDDIDSEGGYVSEGDSYYSYDAEAEWEESKAQMNALFSLVIFPFVGRWLGKKFSFWLWSRYIASPNSLPLPSSLLSMEWLNSMKRIAN